MIDSLPHNSPGRFKALAVGGGRPAAKVALGPGLDASMWDSVFGPGTADAVGAQTRTSPAGAFTRQGWFRRCVDLRAKALAALPWGLYPVDAAPGDREAALWTEADPEPPPALAALGDLGRRFYLAEASLALAGRFYFGKVLDGPGARGALGRLRDVAYWSPYACEPDWSHGRLLFRRTVNGQERFVEPEAVVWGWQPDPLVEMGPGSSDGNAAAHNAAVLAALSRFLGDHLDGGLVKMTVLTTVDGTRMQPEQARDAANAWWGFLRRKGRGQGPPVINNVKPEVIGEGLAELANETLTREQREAIATAFGIPKGKLMDGDNYARAVVTERGFLLDTVIPQARIVEAAFNGHLLREHGLSLRFEPERSEVMQQFELDKAEKVAIICGGPVLSRNEGRRLLGYEDAEGMDDEGGDLDRVDAEGDEKDGSVRALPTLSLSAKLDRLIGEGL